MLEELADILSVCFTLWLQTQMRPGLGRGDPAFGSADQKSFTDQIRLAYGFDGLRFLADHRGQVVQADGSSVEVAHDRVEHGDVQPVEAFGVDLVQGQRLLDVVRPHHDQVVDDGPVAYTA